MELPVALISAALAIGLLALHVALLQGWRPPGQLVRERLDGAGRDRRGRVAVVVASRNGEATIAETVWTAHRQADVYVVSDGSTDATAEVARCAGAHVLELAENVGKPAAIERLLERYALTRRYEAIAILDDDTTIAPDFVGQAMRELKPGVAIVVGRTITRWERGQRWNVWLGSRAYAYWRYQATLRRGQSAARAMTCISGSNSVYRSSVLDAVITAATPYAVDDTWWTLETVRRRLGRIVYAPHADATICDPLGLRDWYRQNVRWNWGMFQGIWGHRVGRRLRWFDLVYGALIVDWIIYVTAAPATLVAMVWLDFIEPARFVAAYLLAVLGWVSVAALATGKWRLVPMAPAIVVIDSIYRATFVHALAKTIRQPRVEVCRWESPVRY